MFFLLRSSLVLSCKAKEPTRPLVGPRGSLFFSPTLIYYEYTLETTTHAGVFPKKKKSNILHGRLPCLPETSGSSSSKSCSKQTVPSCPHCQLTVLLVSRLLSLISNRGERSPALLRAPISARQGGNHQKCRGSSTPPKRLRLSSIRWTRRVGRLLRSPRNRSPRPRRRSSNAQPVSPASNRC